MSHSRARSEAGKSWQHLYKTKQWKRLRAEQLAKHPLCQCPHCAEGRHRWNEATVVDHRKPHKGDRRLFFDPRNLWSLAEECHNRFKQSEERGGLGFLKGHDVRGWPLSREHEWYADR